MYQNAQTRNSVPKLHNVFEFFCVSLCTDYLSDLHTKFQISYTYDANIQYQIWRICYNLFLRYADLITLSLFLSLSHTDRERETKCKKKKKDFSDSGDLKKCKSIKISISII